MTDYRPFSTSGWKLLHPAAKWEMLGYLPDQISTSDPRPAKEQFAANYVGGWSPFQGFTFNPKAMTLNYPGDPPQQAIAEFTLRDERIILFDSAWVMILQKDGTHEISRMD